MPPDIFGFEGGPLSTAMQTLAGGSPPVDPQQAYQYFVQQRQQQEALARQRAEDQDLIAQVERQVNQPAVPQPTPTPVPQPTAAPTPAPAGATGATGEPGVLSNTWQALMGGLGSVWTQIKAGKATATQNPQELAQLAKEQAQQEKEAPAPLKAFREAYGPNTGSFWQDLSNTAKAAAKEPEGAVDAALGVVAGFLPMIAGTMAGGAAGTAVPIIGNIAGAAAGAALTSGEMELGAKALQHITAGALRDKVDLNDEAAVAKWIEGHGQEIFGPAWKAAGTNAAVTALTMGVAGKLGQKVESLLTESRRVVPYTTEAAAGLRQSARLAQAGEIGTVTGGFTGASLGADIAAGDEVDARSAVENAFTLLIPSLLHIPGRFREPKAPAIDVGKAAAKPTVEETPEEKAARILAEQEAETQAKERQAAAKPAEPTKAEEAPPKEEAAPAPQEETDAQRAQREAYESMGTGPLDTEAGVRTALGNPRVGKNTAAIFHEIANAADDSAKADALQKLASTTQSTSLMERADALAKKLTARADADEATRQMVNPDNFVVEQPEHALDALTALHVVQDLAKGIQNEIITEAAAKLKTEVEQRAAERAKTADVATSPLAAGAAAEPAGAVTAPTVSPLAGKSRQRKSAAKGAGEPAGNAAILQAAGGGGEQGPVGGPGAGVGKEISDQRVTPQPKRGRQARTAGADQQRTAEGAIVPPGAAGGAGLAGAKPEVTVDALLKQINAAKSQLALMLKNGLKAKSKEVKEAKAEVARLEKALDDRVAAAPERQAGSALTPEEIEKEIPNPERVRTVDEIVNEANDVMKMVEEALRQAKIRGDTKEEARLSEDLAVMKRELGREADLAINLEGEHWVRAIEQQIEAGRIPVTDQPFYHYIAGGQTRSLLEYLSSNSKNLMYQQVAKLLLKARVLPKIQFDSHEKIRTAGTYRPESDTVAIDAGHYLQNVDRKSLEHTVLHEIVHAATVNALTRAWHALDGHASPKYYASEEYKAAKRIFDAFEHIQQQHGEELGKYYGGTNPLEMVSELFTNAHFQEFLKQVTLPKELAGGKLTKAWDWFVTKFKELLGFKGVENNAFDELMTQSLNVMREREPSEFRGLKYTPQANEAKATPFETAGRRQFYEKYPVSDTEQLARVEDEGKDLTAPSHNVISGIHRDTGMALSHAYRRSNGTYDLYEVTPGSDIRGNPDTVQRGLSHAEVLQQLAAKDHLPNYHKGMPGDTEPQPTKQALQGWKDGTVQFSAHAIKGEDGKPTGKWSIVEGNDVLDRNAGRTRRTVDSYRQVVDAYNQGQFARTKRVSEAKAQEGLPKPDMTITKPSQAMMTLADREAPTKYLGTQAARQANLPEAMRPDLMNIRKISLMENDTEKMAHDHWRPLQAEGRKLLSKFKRSGDDFDKDITALAYDDRARQILSSQNFFGEQELKAHIEDQLTAAKERLDSLDPAYRKELEAYAKKWKDVSNSMYDYMVRNGLIDADTAKGIKSRYSFYVPMRTDLRSSVGKRATGASAESTNPLQRIVNDWHNQIRKNYENKEADAVYSLAEKFNLKLPDGTKLFDLAPITKYTFDEHGNIITTADPLTMDRDAITVMRDGKPFRMRVNDPDFKAALQRVPPNDVQRAVTNGMHAMAMFNATYGGLKTAASPVFGVVNLLRDTGTAILQGDERLSRTQLIKNMVNPRIWNAAIQDSFEPWLGQHKGALGQAARQGAALISRRGIYGLEAQLERPAVNLDPSILQRVGEARRSLLSFEHGKISNVLTFMTKTGENVTRLAIFDAAMKSPKYWESVGKANGTTGAAVEAAMKKASSGQALTAQERQLISHLQSEAGAAAKTGTVNFEPKGRISGPINALFVFANAKTQGARTYAERMGLTGLRGGNTFGERFARGNRYTQYGSLAALAGGIMAAMYGYKNDPDYGKLSDYQKDDYFILHSGGFSPPIPQEIGWAWILGQSLVDAKMNTRWADPTLRQIKGATRFGTGIVQAFWPGGTSMSDPVGAQQGTTSQYFGRMVTPTPIQPFVDYATNQSTFGSPIVTGLTDKGVPPKGVPLYAHNAAKVSPLAAGTSKVLHDVGVAEVAPQQTQYQLNQWFKTQVDLMHAVAPTWGFFNSIFGAPKKSLEGEELPNSFRRRLFQTASPLATRNDLSEVLQREEAKAYDQGKKMTPAVNMLRTADRLASHAPPEQAQRIREDALKRYATMQ